MLFETEIRKAAAFSPCRRYRYYLSRSWFLPEFAKTDQPRPLVFICLNPSKADDKIDDNTVAKCTAWARDWGFDMFEMLNIFAWRDTDPEKMKAAADPVGPDNDAWIERIASEAIAAGGQVVCGWGNHGNHLGRGLQVMLGPLAEVRPLFCLKLNADNSPIHPLYQPKKSKPKAWQE